MWASFARTRGWRASGHKGSEVRIALLGVFGVNNFGNEASLASAVRSIRGQIPRVDLFCICPRPQWVVDFHRLTAIEMSLDALGDVTGSRRALLLQASRTRLLRVIRASQAYKRLRGVSALVIPGTGILDDLGLRPEGVPLDLLVWCAAARLRGARVMFVSVGAGPITNPRSLWLMKTAARMAHHRSFRDTASREFMRSHGLDVSHDPVVPDLVFSLQPEAVGPPSPNPAEGLVVGIGVMDYRGWNIHGERQTEIYRKHVEDTAAIVCDVVTRGHKARLIVGERRDDRVVADVLERVRTAGARYAAGCEAPALGSFVDLFRELGGCDIVIGTRFHNMVCALMLGKPVISIGYAAKNRDLLGEFGLAEFAHDIETLSPSHVIAQFDQLVQRQASLQESIADKAQRYRAELDSYLNGLWGSLATSSSTQ